MPTPIYIPENEWKGSILNAVRQGYKRSDGSAEQAVRDYFGGKDIEPHPMSMDAPQAEYHNRVNAVVLQGYSRNEAEQYVNDFYGKQGLAIPPPMAQQSYGLDMPQEVEKPKAAEVQNPPPSALTSWAAKNFGGTSVGEAGANTQDMAEMQAQGKAAGETMPVAIDAAFPGFTAAITAYGGAKGLTKGLASGEGLGESLKRAGRAAAGEPAIGRMFIPGAEEVSAANEIGKENIDKWAGRLGQALSGVSVGEAGSPSEAILQTNAPAKGFGEFAGTVENLIAPVAAYEGMTKALGGAGRAITGAVERGMPKGIGEATAPSRYEVARMTQSRELPSKTFTEIQSAERAKIAEANAEAEYQRLMNPQASLPSNDPEYIAYQARLRGEVPPTTPPAQSVEVQKWLENRANRPEATNPIEEAAPSTTGSFKLEAEPAVAPVKNLRKTRMDILGDDYNSWIYANERVNSVRGWQDAVETRGRIESRLSPEQVESLEGTYSKMEAVNSKPLGDVYRELREKGAITQPKPDTLNLRHYSSGRSEYRNESPGTTSFWDTGSNIEGKSELGKPIETEKDFFGSDSIIKPNAVVDVSLPKSKIYIAGEGVDPRIDELIRRSPDFQSDTRRPIEQWLPSDRAIVKMLQDKGYLGFKYPGESRLANEVVVFDRKALEPYGVKKTVIRSAEKPTQSIEEIIGSESDTSFNFGANTNKADLEGMTYEQLKSELRKAQRQHQPERVKAINEFMQGGETPPQGMTLTEAVNKAKELAASGNRQGAADLLKKAREFASSEEGSLRIPQPAPKVEFTPAELAQMGDPEARKALISQPDFMDKMVAMHAANEAPAETLKNLSQKPGEAVKWVKSVLSPLSMSPVGEIAGYLFRGKLGEYYQAHKMLRTAFKTIADEFKGMSEGDRLKFILRLQNNMPQATERLNEFADLFRSTLDQYYGAVRNYKQSLPYIEQYFPQYWRKGEKAAADILGKKSLEGSKAFTRERIFGDILDGIANGHQLKTTNPAELFMMKVDEYEKFLMGQRLIEEMKGLNLVKSLGEGEKAQHGWVKINDKMGGGLWAHPDAGRIINNYLSPTAYSTVGAPFKWYMGMSNLLNQAQLGLGAFHGGFTTMEAAISTGATGLKEISSLDRARMRRGIAMLGKSAVLPYSVAENISRGSKFMSDLVATTPLEANKQKIVDMWKASGLRFEMDKGLKLNAIEKVKQAADDVRSGRLQGLFTGAVNTPGAILELAAKPVMESLVPRQKAGVFSLMADTWIKAHPNASHMEMVKAANEMANRVEGRLGQVNYERLFVNNGFKNAVQAIVRSPGWRGGTLVELGGAITDTLGQGGRLLSKGAEKVTSGAIKSNLGKFEGLTDRQAYALSLGLFHATLSGLITATVMAAKEDKPLDQIFSELQPLDFIMPRTGGIDEHGNPERVNLPDYAKDVYAYGKSYGASIVHGAHPMIGVLSDLIRNKDYGGQTIRPRDEDATGQAWSAGKYIVKSFMPFSLRNVQREGERQGEEGVAEIASNPSFKKAAPFIGITPAPAGLYNTPMMEYIYETQRLARPEGGEREADLEKNKEMRRALALQRTGKQDESLSILKQNLSEGKIGKSDIEGYVNKVKYGPIIGPYIRMDWQTALKAYALGNEQERQQVLPFLVKKIAGMKDRPQGEQAAAYSALRAIATDRQGVTWKQIQDAMRNPMLEKEAQSQ